MLEVTEAIPLAAPRPPPQRGLPSSIDGNEVGAAAVTAIASMCSCSGLFCEQSRRSPVSAVGDRGAELQRSSTASVLSGYTVSVCPVNDSMIVGVERLHAVLPQQDA